MSCIAIKATALNMPFPCRHCSPNTRIHFLREMAPPGRGCVVRTFGLVSVPSYPRHLSRHLSRSLSHAPATHVNGRAAGLRPPPLFSTITPTLNFHAIRSAVRLPRASQPCSCPWAGTSSDRARCLTASRLSARGHGRAEVATVFSAAATERRESREVYAPVYPDRAPRWEA